MQLSEALQTVPLFENLLSDDAECPAFLDDGEEVLLQDGERIAQENDEVAFYVVLSGELQVLKKTDDGEMLLATHPPGAFFGELPLLLDTPFFASGKAIGEVRLFKLKDDAFFRMLSRCPSVARTIMKTMAQRTQNVESIVQGREKLISLGTMAAGLAHELNNPAAAARRAAKDLVSTFEALQSQSCRINQQRLSSDESEWVAERGRDAQRIGAQPLTLDTLDHADREDAVAEWLQSHAVANAFGCAAVLVNAGLDVDWLEETASGLPASAFPDVVRWLAASLAVGQLAGEIDEATERISGLVASVKGYAYMDQATLQELDVHDGLVATLTMLGHKMRDHKVTLQKCFDTSLPCLYAHGGELNQVWTNLVDNAIDAMPEGGTLRVSTAREGSNILIEIADTGSGVPPEVQSRIFEPFFTTKDVGKGTGLGLGTAHRIVVSRHGGDLSLKSQPGDTRFQVRLPLGSRK